MRCDQYGIQLIEVSSHMGARPLCAPYQGRIFSRDGSKGVTMDGAGGKIYYTPLSETSYGQPAGLFGINCGHVQYPFVPGVNFQRYFPYPKEENDRRYQQFQWQRAMERDIRATKRECMMFNETGDKEAFDRASVRLKAQKKKYSDYCNDTGLKQHNDRTQVYGFDRSVSSKAVWAERKNRKPIDKSGGSGIILNSKTSDSGKFLLGAISDPNISKSVDEALSVIPSNCRNAIENFISDIVIVENRGYCSYNHDSRRLTIDPKVAADQIVHEYGHVFGDYLNLYEDSEFIDILCDGLDLSDADNVVFTKLITGKTAPRILGDKFVDPYQGRIYLDDNGLEKGKPINPKLLREYISVGFDYYFKKPELLKAKDPKLFEFIERKISNG